MGEIPDSLSPEALVEYNRRGLIPGPQESLKDFTQRVHYCLNLEQELHYKLPSGIDEALESRIPVPLESCQRVAALFDLSPDWVYVFFSNKKLLPWHGGCAWIFQLEEESPPIALFQLRKVFRDQKYYLSIYDREELMAHELVHVGRMMFQEPAFEEILAYQTASSPFRRWAGPLIRSSTESLLFILTMGMLFFFHAYTLYTGIFFSNLLFYGSWSMPFIMVGLACIRLGKRHSQYQSCLKNLQEIFKEKAQAVLYRLTDKEILTFSQNSPEQILSYITQEKENSLRWKMLSLAYLERS